MWACFYFLIEFRIGDGIMGYFVLMLFLANWAVMSVGQVFALVCPNEESATGLAGLSIILSVVFMGFLITESAMPDGWLWAYWCNMLRYILQGLVSNEVGGNEYTVFQGLNSTDSGGRSLDILDDIGSLIDFADLLWGLLPVIADLIENGLKIPGDLILYFFGWAEFDPDNGRFETPYKWHYCMTSVVIFLGSLEIIKLFAIRFIVWTKR
jgi:hypothetical protein